MIILNIFKRIALYSKVVYNFRPYFNNKEKHMVFLEIVDNDVDKDVIAIYDQMMELPPNKYKKDKARYDAYVGKINEHNKEVEYIKSVVESWNLPKILENPHAVTADYFAECAKVGETLKKYRKLTEKYLNFQKEINRVKDDYDEICLEFDSLDEYNQLFDLSKCRYVDCKRKYEITTKSSQILAKFKKNDNLYYPFDKHARIDEIVNEHNDSYLDSVIVHPLFDNINGRSLDNEQRKSILTDENSVLVVAGAGSGKTLTICGKVEYLLKEEKVSPDDILLLSYSKKSADDLQTKISKVSNKLTVGTFHKIGLDILKETQHKLFMVEDQYKAIIEQYFREEMKKRPHMLQTILTYYGLYLSSTKHDKKYKNEGDLYEDLKKSDFTTLKNQLLSLTNDFNARETLKKELVKSFEEMAIANWYFINGIDYIYEAPYEVDVSTFDKRQYMPDFKLKNYPVYHEHYGINKNGKASQFDGVEGNEYVQGMMWKRQIHQTNQTDCIETYSYEFDDGTVFEKLEKELKKRGVEFHPLSDEEIMNALNSIYESRAFKSFINLIRTFLSLYKASYRSDSGFEELKNYSFRNNYEKSRASLFLDIVKDLYHYYMDYLAKEGKIDFDDMILQSIEGLDQTNNFKFKYIIVDEFQDISISRMKFLKRLIKQGDSKLFAVGDDWQAIYRFSGCDLNIFLEFSKYFGDSAITKITTTHRNSQELQDIAGPFIRKNPEQFNKSINSARHLENPVQIMYYTEKKYYAFLDTLREISKKDKAASVLILGRNNKDFEDIALDNRIFIDFRASDETKTVVRCTNFPQMKLTYSTVHGSKGLEDDYVILINADDNRIGFPNKMEDDELLDLVLSHKSEYEYAEERRLWYVALTRTRNYTYIIANSENPSIFLKEIESQCVVINSDYAPEEKRTEISCPHCKTGRLVLRTNEADGSKFYGCSNYPYCDYSINDMRAVARNKRCRRCGDFMIFRKGKWGAFYGCHNYPRCDYTEEYEPESK